MAIQVIDFSNIEKWKSVVKKFATYDVYYLSEYVDAFKLHGDGVPILIYFTTNGNQAINVVFKRCINLIGNQKEKLCGLDFFDIATPYGYGGVLFEKPPTNEELQKFNLEYIDYCTQNNIVCEFTRFHPVLQNAKYLAKICNITDLGPTITMHLTDEKSIWQNLLSKNRNKIRKAEKNNVKICHDNKWENYKTFINIYNKTMKYDNASEYYYFEENFYKSIFNNMKGYSELFYAEHDNKIIAMSIILCCNTQLHYHLSALDPEYRNMGATNLLLYKVALWGYENGYKTFHLGGGLGAKEDQLYKFKQSFYRLSPTTFSIGKKIFLPEIYEKLIKLKNISQMDINNNAFFPLYRLQTEKN